MPLRAGNTWFLLGSPGRRVTLAPTNEASRSADIPSTLEVPAHLSRLLPAATTPPSILARSIPVVGDWNGDGRDTIGVVRGNHFLLRRTYRRGDDLDLAYGRVGDVPLAGDWNGDGIDTIGVRRGNRFFLRPTYRAGGDIVLDYGIATDRPVVGDWNGDGIDTVGAVRADRWFMRYRCRVGADYDYRY